MVNTRLTAKKIALKRTEAKDPNKPKRPATAFFVFMEAFRKRFKDENPTINSVVAVGKAGGAKWKSMSESDKAPFVAKAEQRKTSGISLVQSVISNDDLLTEIFIRLPLLSLILFKSVSKRWLSLIEHAISLIKNDNLTFRPNLEPPAGLFLKNNSLSFDFLPLDNRIPLLPTKFPFGPELQILHSCNGLLLCFSSSLELYVYNPSVADMYKLIPDPDNVKYDCMSLIGSFGLAFDPTKSHHYRVLYVELVNDHFWDRVYQVHSFSSETGNWSLCGPQITENNLYSFGIGVYWNDAIYWKIILRDDIFKFDIMNERLEYISLPTPSTLDLKVHYECRLYESRGCLLLVAKDYDYSRHFTIYEKRNVDSEWSVKYTVNLDDVIKPIPKSWSIYGTLYCIVLEEREEDSFLLMKLDKKVVVKYKIMSKALSTISELGPNDDFFDCCQFIPSFANV